MIWKKEFRFEMPKPIDYAEGYIGINKAMQKAWSGLVILRRDRGVWGSGKEDNLNVRYRPKDIFGPSGQQRYGRAVGEISFGPNTKVTSSKRLNWENEEGESLEPVFLQRLREVFDGNEKEYKKTLRKGGTKEELYVHLPLYKMADKFRSQTNKQLSLPLKEQQAIQAVNNTVEAIEKESGSDVQKVKEEKSFQQVKTPVKLSPTSKILYEKQFYSTMENWKERLQ